jgi:hypothetical protein
MEAISISWKSLFERFGSCFRSGLLGQWFWRDLAKDRRWRSELADWNSCWFGYGRFPIHSCI